MQPSEKRALIYDLVVKMSVYYRSPITDKEQIRMYADDLMDLDLDDISTAFKIYRMDPENVRPPLPSQLKALLLPSDDAQARDAVSRINEALIRFSGDYDYHIEKARAYIGELGWAVVQRNGGWSRMVRMNHEELGPTAQAQWRELAKALQSRHRLGIQDCPPEMPATVERKNTISLSHISDIVKQIEEKRN
jgi:hypothetical protein